MARPQPSPLTVRLPDRTRAELERRATSEGLSLSALVRRALDAELSGT
ncbi:MAG: ribbon-helix-helix protein, CopG family [Candidatus Microthrix parvicella]|jgi:predicted HicB family RNase H-like nuclease|nr:ribbon-helix-helix protein, CopG family [Candidatus Microthrix parvicella]